MSGKQVIQLGDIQETLLIPLYGRAVEAKKKRPMLVDRKAVEMVDAIDYDFRKFDAARSLFGAVLRTAMYDEWVKAFITKHPGGTVVEIGSGLNTRFERLDNGQVHWFDLDLPDTIALRSRFFADAPRRRMLPVSVTSDEWVRTVQQSSGPYFFVAEAVLIYLHEPEGARGRRDDRPRVSRLADGARHRRLMDGQNQDSHDVLKKVAARMHLICDDPRSLDGWGIGLRLLESRTLANAPPSLKPKVPWFLRALGPIVFRRQINSYRLNLFEVT